MENCKNCEHLIARDICYFCDCECKEIEHPRLMGGSKKCECYKKSVKQSKKFQYPKKDTQ